MTTTEEKMINTDQKMTTSKVMTTKEKIQKMRADRKMISIIGTRTVNPISQTLITNTTIQDTIILLNHHKAITPVDPHPITVSPMISPGTTTIIALTSNHKTMLTTVTIKGENLTIQNQTIISRNRIQKLYQM